MEDYNAKQFQRCILVCIWVSFLVLGCVTSSGEMNSEVEGDVDAGTNNQSNDPDDTGTDNGADGEVNFDECPLLEPGDVVNGAVLAENTCHRVEASLVVESGVLEIEAGVYLGFVGNSFAPGSGPSLQISGDGAMNARGTANNMIVMTNGAFGPDGTTPFGWTGVHFVNTREDNIVDYLEIKNDRGLFGSMSVKNSDVKVRNSKMGTFVGDADGSFALDDDPSTVDFDHNTIAFTVKLGLRSASSFGKNNIYLEEATLQLDGYLGIDEDVVLPNPGVPYMVGSSDLAGGLMGLRAGVTIEPGVVLDFHRGQQRIETDFARESSASGPANSHGYIVADAEGGDPIVFTSSADQGWSGITLQSPDNIFRNVIIENVTEPHGSDSAVRVGTFEPDVAAPSLLIEYSVFKNTKGAIYAFNGAEVLSCESLEFEEVEGVTISAQSGNESNVCGGTF